MKKHKYFIVISMLVIGLTACEDLDRYPQTQVSPELFFNTEEDLALYVNGLIQFPDRSSYLADQNTDNAATTGAVEMKTVMAGTANSQNITGGWSWSRLRNVNYFLENYQKAAVSNEVKNHYAGLARYYRADFYMEKVKRFSNVPWYSATLNPTDKELYKTQDSRAMVMDSVMADLEFAARNIREKVPTGTPGKWAAKMAQAKIALYEGTYRKYHTELNLQNTAGTYLQKAADVAGEIRASGKFSVYNPVKTADDYGTLFSSQDLLTNGK